MEDIREKYAPPGGGGVRATGNMGGATAPASVNPRRKPQSQSVSLKNDPSFSPPSLQHAPPNRDHIATLLPLKEQQQKNLGIRGQDVSKGPHPMASIDTEHSSGGDSHIRSNPDDWYTSWNTKVQENNQTAFNDGDPPYYLTNKGKKTKPVTNSNSSNTNTSYDSLGPNDEAHPRYDNGLSYALGGGLPISLNQNPLFRATADDSISDSGSFRSVIDDLTIKNQKLKKRLKKLERLHCNDESTDKLFEVRVHGLTLDKKRELHDLLQRFASTLNKDPNVKSSSSGGYINSSVGASPFTKSSTNPHSSSMPLTNPTDSAYASESRISNTPSNAILPSRIPPGGRAPLAATSQAVAQHSTEKSKMKMVVKRLEHLFTGREALRSALSPSQAQQDIANKAAQDDMKAKMAAGEPIEEEGPREAHLMTWQEDRDMTDAEQAAGSAGSGDDSSGARKMVDLVQQRPTRPLDLDPQRSQISADNVVYLEHMTLSLEDNNANFIPDEKHKTSNWVYLNLITNLAQLHTLNVTVPFIKRAIQQFSTKLELSADGKKIRWKGGSEGTKLSSDGSRSASGENSNSDESSPDDNNARVGSNPNAHSSGVTLSSTAASSGGLKNSGMASSSMNGGISIGNTASSVTNRSPPKSPRQVMLERFKYKPMLGAFTTHRAYDEGMESDATSSADSLIPADVSPGPPPILDSNSGTQPLENLKRMAPIDGPVIYFGGSFCIDLSSQVVFREGSSEGNNQQYCRHSEIPIGPERPPSQCSSLDRTQSALFGNDCSPTALDGNFDDVEMDLIPFEPSSFAAESELVQPRELEASGLGGVRPEDNFMLHVKTSHGHNDVSKLRIRHIIPRSSLEVFFEDGKRPETKDSPPSGGSPHYVVSVENRSLAPSKLPSPSYGIFSSSSEESEAPKSTSSDSRMVSDSDMSYNFPIDLDSRSEAEDDAGGWTTSGNNSRMELDNQEEEEQTAASTAATAGGSVYNGDLSPLRGEPNHKSVLLKPMDHLSINKEAGIGMPFDSSRSSPAPSSRMHLKRAHESFHDPLQPGGGKPPTKIERTEY